MGRAERDIDQLRPFKPISRGETDLPRGNLSPAGKPISRGETYLPRGNQSPARKPISRGEADSQPISRGEADFPKETDFPRRAHLSRGSSVVSIALLAPITSLRSRAVRNLVQASCFFDNASCCNARSKPHGVAFAASMFVRLSFGISARGICGTPSNCKLPDVVAHACEMQRSRSS